MDYNYNDERLKAELERVQAETAEREAKGEFFSSLTTLLNILNVCIIVFMVLIVIVGTIVGAKLLGT